MKFTPVHIKWANKVLKSKYFVVLTDKESVIWFDGANPEDFADELALASQTAELVDMQDKLEQLVIRHEEALNKLTSGKRVKRDRKTK